MPRSVPQIEVMFAIDANNILDLSAEEKSTGRNSRVTMKNDERCLSTDEVECYKIEVMAFSRGDIELDLKCLFMEQEDNNEELVVQTETDNIDDEYTNQEPAVQNEAPLACGVRLDRPQIKTFLNDYNRFYFVWLLIILLCWVQN